METKLIGSGVFLETYATKRKRVTQRLDPDPRDLLLQLEQSDGDLGLWDVLDATGLGELEADGLVDRVEQQDNSPRIRLTEQGRRLLKYIHAG